MGLYQRRRPSPIQIWPTRVRRQESEQSTESPKSSDSPSSPDSPESSGLPSPDSPDSPKSSGTPSPSPTQSSFSTSLPPPPPPPTETAAPSQIAPQAPSTTEASSTTEISSTTAVASATAASSTTAVPSSTAPSLRPPPPPSGAAGNANPLLPQESSVPNGTEPSAPQDQTPTITSQPVSLGTGVPAVTATEPISSSFSSVRRPVTPPPNETGTPSPSNGIQPSGTDATSAPVQSGELDGESTGIGREHKNDHGTILSKGAEAAAITLSIMGFIALIVGIVYFFKRRRRRQRGAPMRHAEDAFNPSNNGSLHEPETAHLDNGLSYHDPHMTKSSTDSASLFGGSHYQRPETVSTNSNPSRIQAPAPIAPPQPTPNPFADPPRNKAWDQLRGRPRSTTLTDRGSWVANPFKDPASERFDPFGELQEKAREERRRYMAEVRREGEERRRMEMERERFAEEEYLEKERYRR